VVSDALLDELEDKLRVKFGASPEDAGAIRAKLASGADVVAPAIVIDAIKNDPTITVCWNARLSAMRTISLAATVICSIAQFNLKAHAGIPIVTARQFLDAIVPGSQDP
jgi:hypothetical protein